MFLNFHTHSHQHLSDNVQGYASERSVYNVVLGNETDEFFIQNYYPRSDDQSLVLFSAGVHPWYLNPDLCSQHLCRLDELLTRKKILMVGECGLDKVRGENFNLQREVFLNQLELALQFSVPVVIHCVRAFDEVIQICRPFLGKIPLIFHGFRKSPQLAKQLIDLGFQLSFGPSLFHTNSALLLEHIIANNWPFLLETDDQDIPIQFLYDQFSKVKKVEVDVIKDLIFANWKSLGII